jgi:hypothetical protein
MAIGLLNALWIYNPKYLNSATFSMGNLLHVKLQAIFIYNALVLPTLILRPFDLQKFSKIEIINYNPSALGDNKTASSAKAMKKIYKVASSSTYRFCYVILYFSKYYNKYGYT